MSVCGLRWLLLPLVCCSTMGLAVAETLPPEPAVAPSPPDPAIPPQALVPIAAPSRTTLGRHQFGVEVGGSGVFQLAYRLRVVGPLHLEVGAFGLPHSPVHATFGLLVAPPVDDPWRPHIGLAVGHAGILGRSYPAGCEPDTPGCEATETFDYVNYFSGRIGVGYAFGARRRHTLGFDVGAWYGWRGESRTAPDGTETQTSRRVLWPIGGISYFFRI